MTEPTSSVPPADPAAKADDPLPHKSGHGPKSGFAILGDLVVEPINYLLVALPILAVIEVFYHGHAPGWLVFLVACVAIVPLAGLMGRATENLAEVMGPGIGGLMNSTFGNAAELIIALMALSKGKTEFVKASITGSIIGNVLLVLGAAFVCGGIYHKKQKFSSTAASMSATLLALAGIGLLMPSFYFYSVQFNQLVQHAPATHVDGGRGGPPAAAAAGAAAAGAAAELADVQIKNLSVEICVVLAATYVLSLLFSLRTHRHLYDGEEPLPTLGEGHGPEWTSATSIGVLLIATIGVAWASEALVGSVEAAAKSLGLTELFIGVIVVAIVGNAAEHSTAVMVAMKNKMDLAVNIAIGSSIQIALFVVPTLVFASLFMGKENVLDLNFSPLEVIAILGTIGVLAIACSDGESNWMEGVMLLAVYCTIALVFFHWPESPELSREAAHDHPPAAKAHL